MHDIQTLETLLTYSVQEWRDFVRDEARMTSRHLRTLDVFLLESNTQRVDSREGLHSIVEAMINHPDHWYLVVQNPPQRFESRLPLVSMPASVEVTSELTVHVVVPQFRHPDPVRISSRCRVGKPKLLLFWMKHHVDILITVHGARKGDNSLLSVNQPIHEGGSYWPRVTPACACFLSALPEK